MVVIFVRRIPFQYSPPKCRRDESVVWKWALLMRLLLVLGKKNRTQGKLDISNTLQGVLDHVGRSTNKCMPNEWMNFIKSKRLVEHRNVISQATPHKNTVFQKSGEENPCRRNTQRRLFNKIAQTRMTHKPCNLPKNPTV